MVCSQMGSRTVRVFLGGATILNTRVNSGTTKSTAKVDGAKTTLTPSLIVMSALMSMTRRRERGFSSGNRATRTEEVSCLT